MGWASRRKRERRSASPQENSAPVGQGSENTSGVATECEGAVAPGRHGWGGRRTGAGRPRLYTNDAERQAAYRARRRSGTSSGREKEEGKPPDGGAPGIKWDSSTRERLVIGSASIASGGSRNGSSEHSELGRHS
jgi:hypothetical protein